MSDLISRQAAIDALRGYLVGKRCPDDGTLTCRLIENEVINKLPPAQPTPSQVAKDIAMIVENGQDMRVIAQPERIKGRWLPWKYAMPGKEYKFHKCSVCGVCDEYITDVPRPNGTIGRLESIRNFCPNCGADMREVTT